MKRRFLRSKLPPWAPAIDRERECLALRQQLLDEEWARRQARGAACPNSRLRRAYRRLARDREWLRQREEQRRAEERAMQPALDVTAARIAAGDAAWQVAHPEETDPNWEAPR